MLLQDQSEANNASRGANRRAVQKDKEIPQLRDAMRKAEAYNAAPKG